MSFMEYALIILIVILIFAFGLSFTSITQTGPCVVDFPRSIEGGNVVRVRESVNYILYSRGHGSEDGEECQTETYVTREEYKKMMGVIGNERD